MNILTWIVQALAAIGFFLAGFTKAASSVDELVANGMGWAADVPTWLPAFIGVAEIIGAIGLILPTALRIRPELTNYAALGLGLTMVLAVIFHIFRGEFSMIMPGLILLIMVGFIYWARTRKVPITAKA